MNAILSGLLKLLVAQSTFTFLSSTICPSCQNTTRRRLHPARSTSLLKYVLAFTFSSHLFDIALTLCQANVVEIKVLAGSEAFNEALLKEKPSFANATTWRLIGCLLLGCFCQTMNGYDGMLLNGLNSNAQFLDFFHGEQSGPWQAVTSTIYQIGGLCALPFVGLFVDTWGRKPGMFIGEYPDRLLLCLRLPSMAQMLMIAELGTTIIIVGCIINGLTALNVDSTPQLRAGRFILGFGVSIVSAAGPIVSLSQINTS